MSMVIQKSLVGFDEDCTEILKELPDKKKSEYVREAVKFFHLNKNKNFKEEIKEVENIGVEF